MFYSFDSFSLTIAVLITTWNFPSRVLTTATDDNNTKRSTLGDLLSFFEIILRDLGEKHPPHGQRRTNTSNQRKRKQNAKRRERGWFAAAVMWRLRNCSCDICRPKQTSAASSGSSSGWWVSQFWPYLTTSEERPKARAVCRWYHPGMFVSFSVNVQGR